MQAAKEEPSLLIEEFAQKAQELKQHIATPLIPIFYSVSGFSAPALERLKELCIAWSTEEQWPLLKKRK